MDPVKAFAAIAGYIASIILAFLWLDERHENAGSAERALIDSKRYTLNIAISDLSSTITRYNTMEGMGQLSDTNQIRRDELQEQRQLYIAESASLSEQKVALSQ